jgi:hypothetical protein
MSTDLTDETREAMATLKAYDGPQTVVQFEPSEDRIVIDDEGKRHAGKTEPFIKLGLGFLKVAAEMKGPQISVFIVICMHVNENGRSWPGIRKICKESGYASEAVVKAIRDLRDAGFIRIIPRKNNQTTIYEPVLAAFGRSNPKAFRSSKHAEGVSPTETGCFAYRNAGVSPTETKQEPMNKNQEQDGADAHALPSGRGPEAKARKPQRDPLAIQADFGTLAAAGRAAGRDGAPGAHPLAGRWPHLVDLARAFEDASGTSLADLPKSQATLWAKQLEGHYAIGLTPDDERELVRMAKAKKWDLYSPGSADKLIGHLRRQSPTLTEPQYAQPSF